MQSVNWYGGEEDETHFLLQCSSYTHLRDVLAKKLENINPQPSGAVLYYNDILMASMLNCTEK